MTEPLADPTPKDPDPRALRRAEPRATVSIAGAGCIVAVIGVLVIAGDRLNIGDDGSSSQVPGVLLCLAVLAAGLLVLKAFPTGALATAGTVATLLALPPLLFFLSFDKGGGPPYSTELILGGSAAGWLIAYLWGPARNHPILLGTGLVAAWLFVLQLIEKPFTAPFGIFDGFAGSLSSEVPGDAGRFSLDTPSPTTMGALSLMFGAGYLVTARVLDRRGQAGRATPLVAAGLLALTASVLLLANDLKELGTALLLLVLGSALAAGGATVGRRGTTWLGGVAIGFSVVLFVGKIAPEDNATLGGLLLLVFGVAVVLAAHAIGTVLGEPDEIEPGPSTFRRAPTPAPNTPSEPSLGS